MGVLESKEPEEYSQIIFSRLFYDLINTTKPRTTKEFSKNRFILRIFQVQVLVLLKAITQSILGQNLNPGTFSESRDQELSFCTKVSRINSIFDQEISCLEKRPVLLPTIVSQ